MDRFVKVGLLTMFSITGLTWTNFLVMGAIEYIF